MDMDMEKQATLMKVTSVLSVTVIKTLFFRLNELSVLVSFFLTVLKMKFNTEKEIW